VRAAIVARCADVLVDVELPPQLEMASATGSVARSASGRRMAAMLASRDAGGVWKVSSRA